MCTGLFVATAAEANRRQPLITSIVLLVLVGGAIRGTAYYLALRARQRRGDRTARTPPVWVDVVYATVWLLALLAAIRALFSDGGLKVAALAIVPLVLLAPPAIESIRALLRRPRAPRTGKPPTP